MWKEQLCKRKVGDFCYVFPGPKTFRDLRETGPRSGEFSPCFPVFDPPEKPTYFLNTKFGLEQGMKSYYSMDTAHNFLFACIF